MFGWAIARTEKAPRHLDQMTLCWNNQLQIQRLHAPEIDLDQKEHTQHCRPRPVNDPDSKSKLYPGGVDRNAYDHAADCSIAQQRHRRIRFRFTRQDTKGTPKIRCCDVVLTHCASLMPSMAMIEPKKKRTHILTF